MIRKILRGVLLSNIAGAVLAVAGLGLCLADAASAQGSPSVSTSNAGQILQNLSGGGFKAATQTQPAPPPSNEPIVLQPSPQAGDVHTVSDLERVMSIRAGQRLVQFGYRQVGSGSAVMVPQTGAVQDDYVLGPGDQINISLRGSENAEYSVFVDRNGQISVPRLRPVAAAGITLGELRKNLSAAIHTNYVSTEAYITVNQLRQVSVLVVGEVANPGARIVTGLSSPLDAILLSGGVKKNGSLRAIQIVRRGQITTIDLYSVLTGRGAAHLPQLQNGDRVFVPPIGGTVAIAGFVRRPAIYELRAGQRIIGIEELLALANGTSMQGAYTISLERLQSDGKRRFTDITRERGAVAAEGAIVVVKAAVDYAFGRVEMMGAIRTPGAFALDKFPTLHDLLPSADALMPNAYTLFGFIDRIDPATLARVVVPFSPIRVADGKSDLPLVTGDKVYVLTKNAMISLLGTAAPATTEWTPAADKPAPPPSPDIAKAQSALAQAAAGQSNPASGNAAAASAKEEQGAPDATPPSESLQFASEDILYFQNRLSDYRATIGGAVHDPGDYLVAPGTNLAEVVMAAGGLNIEADISKFEITSSVIDGSAGFSTTVQNSYDVPQAQYAAIPIRPNDSILFHHVFTDRLNGSITVSGEVRRPGIYPIVRGQRLSEILARAGGFTDLAFPYGAIFQRQSLKRSEQQGNQRMAEELERQLMAQLGSPVQGANAPRDASIVQAYVLELRQKVPVGRMVVVADPAELAKDKSHDPLLQPGDTIYVPQQPDSVTVLGAVKQPGHYAFSEGQNAFDYIADAGGSANDGDEGMAFVVYPDGRARAVSPGWFRLGTESVPRGSTIFVPPLLFSDRWLPYTTTLMEIVKDLAVSAASIAVLSKQ